MRQAPGFWWSLVSAILGIAVGIVLLLWPLRGVLSLTLVLIVFFVIEGVASIMFALEHKRELSGRWGWMLASGIIDLILATIILAGLPGTAPGRSPLRRPLYSRPPSCSMTTRRTKPTKSDTMTAAISADPSRDVVLQALLTDDLMGFTEFAFGVVRPGIQFKPNWHIEAVTYKLSQVAKGLVRRLIITLPPRTLKSLCASVALPAWFLGHYPLGTGGRGLVFRYSRAQPRERLPPRG